MIRQYARYVTLVGSFIALAIGYANCAPAFKAAGESGIVDQASVPVCEDALKAAFNTTYRPLVTDAALCVSCHNDAGVSPYKFASSNLTKAFAAFQQVGVNQVDANAVSTIHAPPITGPQNQTRFAAARSAWDLAYASYQTCMGSTPTDALIGDVQMNQKNIPELYFGDGRVVRMTWGLFSEALPTTARLNAYFTIDIRVNYQVIDGVKLPTGYAFANPSLEMLEGDIEYDVQGLSVQVNGRQLDGIDALLSSTVLARGIDPNIMYNGEVAVPLENVSSADKISFSLVKAVKRARTDNPPTPPNPTIKADGPFTRTAQIGVTIGNDGTARRWCVTTKSTRPASTSAFCPGYENAIVTNGGWTSARPTDLDMAVTLGRAPNENENIPIYVWVANSDLKISAAAGTSSVIYDTTAPAKVSFTSVTVSGTQVADINGLSDSSEPVSWCVKEAADMQTVTNGCNSFSPTKPQYVGLTQYGLRYVAVYVRDRAGNNGAVSDVKTVNNTYGRISYTQLTTAGDARGVIQNRCFSCHAAGQAQSGKWNASDYGDTVAKKSMIKSRITSTTATVMPPTGALPEKEIDLLLLWINQPGTPVQ